MNIECMLNLVRSFCEQYVVESRCIRIHGYLAVTDIVDDFLDDGFIFISVINESGVPVYNVYEVSQGNINIVPAVYGHSFTACLDLFVTSCIYQADNPDDLVLLGSQSFVCALDNGKPIIN